MASFGPGTIVGPGELYDTTRRPAQGRSSRAEWRVPSLTILYHPCPARVGEITRLVELLSGGCCRLSRLEPAFAPPGAKGGEPLADPYLSRAPGCTLSAADGVLLEPERGSAVAVDGIPLVAARTITGAALDNGVVLELGDRVVLLLHYLGPPKTRQPSLGLVGESEVLERLRRDILRVANLSVPVLLRGESGTGKELVARAIASHGARANGPFVAVNVAALPPTLATAELFGHAEGAYTGAGRSRPGRFATARGGTLFLDEIGAASLELQASLLRALQSNEIQPLGDSRTETVDVRVVSATDEDLEGAVRRGSFREGLYHRLAGYQIVVPPLRERRDDVGRLLFHFLDEALRAAGDAYRLQELARAEPWLPAGVVADLARHDWPGNVRQLAQVTRRLSLIAREQGEIRLEDLSLGGRGESAKVVDIRAGAMPPGPGPATAHRPPSLIDDAALAAALRDNRWRIAATAKQLGIARNSLYALMEASGRIRKAKDIPRDEIRRSHEACAGDVDAMAEQLEASAHGIRLRLKELGLS